MDIPCTKCGEPWDIYHIYHDAEPGDFERTGGLIKSCPACPNPEILAKMSNTEKARLNTVAELADLLGDDVDGLASTLEDFGLV